MGLQRKKVTVRTKKGKTFQRSMMVKANGPAKAGARKKLRSQNGDVEKTKATNHWYHTGMANAGLGIGSNLGRMSGERADPHMKTFKHAGHMLVGSVAGSALGYGVGRATSKHLSNRTKMILGTAGHAVGLIGAAYNHDRTFASIARTHGTGRRY